MLSKQYFSKFNEIAMSGISKHSSNLIVEFMSHLELEHHGRLGSTWRPFLLSIRLFRSVNPRSRSAEFEPKTYRSWARTLNLTIWCVHVTYCSKISHGDFIPIILNNLHAFSEYAIVEYHNLSDEKTHK